MEQTPAKPRILVVDDNADAATSLGRLLGLLGNDVCVAYSGAAALAEIARSPPHIVLLDLGMPGMDGLETARHIRQCDQWRKIPIVAITGWGQDQDRQRTARAGFAAHLTKPVSIDELERVLARLLAGCSSAESSADPPPSQDSPP